MAGNVYSFLDVSATLVGPGGVVDLGAGAQIAEEGIGYEMEGDKTTLTVGADGAPMLTLNATTAGAITVRTLKTSPTNGLLQVMYSLQSASSALWGQNVLVIRDPTRGDLVTASVVAFRRNPSNTYARNANMLEWAFVAGVLIPLLGIGQPTSL